jgi:large subunit ribosomal protein L15
MQLHELSPKHKLKKKKRVGRGGKRGTYSGRGSKGQKSRAGRKMQPVIRELIKRYPKLRGYRFKRRQKNIAVLNTGILEEKFKDSDVINPKVLFERGLVRRIKGRMPKVKILSKGEITKKLIIKNCKVSKTAKNKIEKAGGTIK